MASVDPPHALRSGLAPGGAEPGGAAAGVAAAGVAAAGTGPRRMERRDVLTAAGYAALVVLLALSGLSNGSLVQDGPRLPLEASMAMMLVASASIAWRRSRPWTVLAVAGPLSLVEMALGGQVSAYVLFFEAMFEPVMHGSARLARWTTRLGVAATALGMLTAGVLGEQMHVLMIVMVAALVVMVPLLWGWEVRHHRTARQAAEHLAELQQELAAAQAAGAVEAERRRIAHDLHDVISGHLSAVSLHTSLAASLPDQASRSSSLATARDSALAALRDLRSMIGVLAEEESGGEPTVTLSWSSLADRLRGRDPAAHVVVDERVDDPAAVAPAVQAALLRLGAEAVTNAVRHGAAPIALEVRLETSDEARPRSRSQSQPRPQQEPQPQPQPQPQPRDAGAQTVVVLELVNRRSDPSAAGSGMGRRAIADRAAAVGGEAISGPLADDPGAWHVLARLPAAPPSPAAPRPAVHSPAASEEIPR